MTMTTSTRTSFADLAEDFGERWNRFWFTPAEALPCCVLRIVVGLLAAVHFLDLAGGLSLWFASDGVLPPAATSRLLELTSATGASYHYSYLSRLGPKELGVLHGLAIMVSLVFAAGLVPRVTGAMVLVAMLAYVHRVPQVAGHVEPVLSFLIAYLLIAPSGACLSLGRWLFPRARKQSPLSGTEDPDQPSVAANISLRLIQVHLAMFYAMMGLTKLYGDAWWDGSAIWILLAQTESRPLDLTGLRRFGQPGQYLLNFWTHSVVYFELAFPLLIWSRLLRPVMLALSVLIWISVILATGHLLFGLTMLAASLAFVPGETLRSLAGRQTAALG